MKATIFLWLASLFAVGHAPRHEVLSGLLHSFIDLKTSFDPFLEVDLKHNNTKTEMRIAKMKNGSMTEGNPSKYNPGHNGTVLRIYNLTQNDTGVYTAEATLPDGTMIKEDFNLTVYGPVPIAEITPEVKRKGDQCNVTLHCSILSNTSDFSYTWKYRDGDSEYQSINDTGNIIQKMLPPDHQDMGFICIVHNLVDQKNASYHIEHCSEKMKERTHFPIIFSAILVLLVFGAILWKCRKRPSRGDQNHNLRPPVQDTESQESPFIKIPLGKTESMKTGEADEEDSKLKDKPSCDDSVIEVESSL